MKKILSLVLAVMMLSAVAFAATDVEIGAGTTDANAVVYHEPCSAIKIYATAFEDEDGPIDANVPFTSEYFAVSAKKFDKGASMVKSVAFNDKDEVLEIKLVDDKTLYINEKDIDTDNDNAYDGAANLVIKELEVKAKKKYEKNDRVLLKKNATYAYVGPTDFVLGYLFTELPVLNGETLEATLEPKMFPNANSYNEGNDDLTKDGSDLVAYRTLKLKAPRGSSATYSDFEITAVDAEGTELAYIEFRGYKNDVISLSYDNEPDLALVKKYSDAELTFVNMAGEFSAKAYVEVYADEDEFVYELKDGKLVASSLKWDDDAYAFVGKVSALGKYVISDTKLDVAANAGSTTTNPDTGANDVVGVAVALAAVAAISAAAVSLKK